MTPRSLADAAGIRESLVTEGEHKRGGVHVCAISSSFDVLGMVTRVVLRVLYTSAVESQMASLFALGRNLLQKHAYGHMANHWGP